MQDQTKDDDTEPTTDSESNDITLNRWAHEHGMDSMLAAREFLDL